MPQLGLTMTEGLVSEWHKKEGDMVKKGDILLSIETDKLQHEYESPVDGILLKIAAATGSEVPVQGLLGYIGAEDEKIASSAEDQAAPPEAALEAPEVKQVCSKGGKRVKATPFARKLAKEMGVDLTTVAGSGPDGRIEAQDIKSIVKENAASQFGASLSASDAVQTPGKESTLWNDSSGGRCEQMNAMRRAIAKNMTASWTSIPAVTYHRQVDTTAFAEMKKQLNTGDTHVSYTDILVKIAAITLRSFPYVNASVDGNNIILHKSINVGVAVGMEHGLIVPVVKDAQNKGLQEIAAELKTLTKNAREGRLTQEDITGGTFTITNLGMFGMESFSPIINPPESAILGVNAIKKQAVEMDGAIEMRLMMTLSLTADHRIIDGMMAAQFMQTLCDFIENPLKLLL